MIDLISSIEGFVEEESRMEEMISKQKVVINQFKIVLEVLGGFTIFCLSVLEGDGTLVRCKPLLQLLFLQCLK